MVDDHNKAFAAWALIRRELETAPNLITLDHHTDTIEAFNDLAYRIARAKNIDRDDVENLLVSRIHWRSDSSVLKAARNLDHDEHIVASTLSGVIDNAFVIQLSDPNGMQSNEQAQYQSALPPWEPGTEIGPLPDRPQPPFTYARRADGVFTIGHECAIGCAKSPHDDDCLVAIANQVIESDYLDDQLARGAEMAAAVGLESIHEAPYILDIDLDVFHTMASIKPKDASTFYRLIQGAYALTIATEEGCFVDEWLEDSKPPPIDEVLDAILQHVVNALNHG